MPAICLISFTISKEHLQSPEPSPESEFFGCLNMSSKVILKSNSLRLISMLVPQGSLDQTPEQKISLRTRNGSFVSWNSIQFPEIKSFYQFRNVVWIPENSRLCDWQLTYPIHTSGIYIYSNLWTSKQFLISLLFSDTVLALLIIAKIWKQSKCPLTDKWIKKKWYIYYHYIYIYGIYILYYSAIKKNEIMLFTATWMDLEIITLSQKEKDKYHVISFTHGI